MSDQLTLLVVDDDKNVLPALAGLLEVHCPYRVLSASGFDEAMRLLDGGVDLLVVDAVLPIPHSGKEIAHAARTARRETAIVLISAEWKPELSAFPEGTVFLLKPFGIHQLREAIDLAIAKASS